MNRDRELLLHSLAAIAYRTQKALRDAPDSFPDFAPGHQVRTPAEILRHMTSLMGFTQTLFRGGSYPVQPDPLPTFGEEILRFAQVTGDRLGADQAQPARPDLQWPARPA